MDTRPDPVYRRLLAQHDWGTILKKTVIFAHFKISIRKWIGEVPDPVAVSQQAVEQTLDGSRRWKQTCPLLNHVYGVARGIIWNFGKVKANSAKALPALDESSLDEEQDLLDGMADDQPHVEDFLVSSEHAGSFYGKVVDVLAGEPLLEKVFDLLMDGHKPREIAEKLELSRVDMYKLTRQLRMKLNHLVPNKKADRDPEQPSRREDA